MHRFEKCQSSLNFAFYDSPHLEKPRPETEAVLCVIRWFTNYVNMI